MKISKNSLEKVKKICQLVQELTLDDIETAYSVAEEQLNYKNPLWGERQAMFNEIGAKNHRIIYAIAVLWGVLRAVDSSPEKQEWTC